jgi:hypothetical protein
MMKNTRVPCDTGMALTSEAVDRGGKRAVPCRWRVLALSSLGLVTVAGCMPDVSGQIAQANAMAAQAQAAAQSRVDGALTVNSSPYSVTHCLSGQLSGFNGVDVLGVDGSRVRLVEEVDGSETVIQMGTGATPVTMKACGKIDVQPANVVVNGVRVVRGTAQMDCTSGELHVAGNVTFQCGT